MAERGELTRQKLIDTALRLFRDDGYHATTMRRIATESGVSLSNAYYYFASKDDLGHVLYRRVQGRPGADELLVSHDTAIAGVRVVNGCREPSAAYLLSGPGLHPEAATLGAIW